MSPRPLGSGVRFDDRDAVEAGNRHLLDDSSIRLRRLVTLVEWAARAVTLGWIIDASDKDDQDRSMIGIDHAGAG